MAGMIIGLAAMLVFPLCGAAAEEQASQFVKPWFCHDLDCPPYKVCPIFPLVCESFVLYLRRKC